MKLPNSPYTGNMPVAIVLVVSIVIWVVVIALLLT